MFCSLSPGTHIPITFWLAEDKTGWRVIFIFLRSTENSEGRKNTDIRQVLPKAERANQGDRAIGSR